MTDAKPMSESYWVEPGRLLAGEHPGHWEDRVVRRYLCGLLDAGVRVFVDLSERADAVTPYRDMLAKICRERGIHAEYCWEPLPADTVPEHADDVVHALRRIQSGLDSSTRVFVHCSDGIDRTGMVMGCWLVERGYDPEAALDELERRFAAMAKSKIYRSTPSNALFAEWVENWVPRLGLRIDQGQAC
jgi:hypothetical protein